MFDTVSLFPAEEQLEQIAAVQRGMNAALAQMCRLLVGLHTDALERDVEFVGDQVALLLQVSPMTAGTWSGWRCRRQPCQGCWSWSRPIC